MLVPFKQRTLTEAQFKITGRAAKREGLCLGAAVLREGDMFGKAEVDDFEVALVVHQQVFGLQVTVCHAHAVDIFEGADLEALVSLNFKIYRPTVICIEIIEKDLLNSKIYKYLENLNYKKIWTSKSNFNHIFIEK